MVSKGRWMGGGDVRIGAFMGIILGWKGVILALILSYLIGSITAAILLISKKVKLQSQVPFAPFLVFATFISLLFQEKIIEWYFRISWL
jgi:prepilin signal peptidase PulO-like enzyme (type II secretory pathway)